MSKPSPAPCSGERSPSYLAPALDAGMATFFAEEIIEAIRYLKSPNFYTKQEDPLRTTSGLERQTM